MGSRFLRELERRVIVVDGAMGTSIHAADLDLERDYCGCENCTDVVSLTRPDVLEGLHAAFLESGADCVETNSFGGASHVLAENGIAERAFELNKAAAEVARATCDRFEADGKPRFVLGSMGPGTKLITLDQIGWDDLHASYRVQASGLIAGGADAFIVETCQDLLQVKCAINACLDALSDAGKSVSDIPIMVSVTIEQTGTMLMGTSIEGAVAALSSYPIVSLGLNCATGPVEMAEHVAYLGRHWRRPGRYVSVIPNAGLPVLVEGRTEYPLGPGPFAESIAGYVRDLGVTIVGGCCGTTPGHIKALAEKVRGIAPGGPVPKAAPGASTSLYGPVEHRQDNSILIVGERCNASGSKKFKRLLEESDWDGVVSLAREQVRDGSHVLDLNVDATGRDNARDMAEAVKRLVRQVDAPLMLDSTQWATFEAGLKHAPGKCIINSANFEEGEEKFDRICELARRYGAAVVIGTIDEDPEESMARTAERKLAIATRGIERATSVHGLAEEDVFIDPLVLPISTGMDSDRRSGLELVEGVRRIAKAHPKVQIVCGLSNVSFGLSPAARVVLNSVFLHELTEAGLTGAIVHASKILPLNKIEEAQRDAALELIYDRRREGHDPLAAYIELFRGVESVGTSAKARREMTLEERLRDHIIDGRKEGLGDCLEEALRAYAPLAIINDHLLDGMKTVGELFGSGQMQLPFVLQSAEVMKLAVSKLEPLMEKAEGQSRGSIVLATVKGDVHDIGKNLVDIILSNNGFTVHNLGIKQPIADILRALEETRADAIGLSGLLVKSVNVMEENLREMNERGVSVPVILGGAALTRHYAEGHLRGVYGGKLYYGKDAFEGLRVMDYLETGRLGEIDTEIAARLTKRTAAEEVVASSRARQAEAQSAFEAGKTAGVAVVERSAVARGVEVPRAPFWGSRVVEGIDPAQVYPFINPVALFRTQWQFKKGKMSDAEYEARMEEMVYPVYERLKAQCREEKLLRPAVVYGYWPCASSGNDLVIFDPEDQEREIERFVFPRQDSRARLCISDFFRDVSDGVRDVVAMSCVTMGKTISEAARELYAANNYTEYLYLHGLGVEAAEGLAEMWHKRIRQELGIAGEDSPAVKGLFTQGYRGSRYSFGYPACPDMRDQEILFRLLRPERIGCELTENWQIDPEQSTSAIVVHHPEARYFNV